MKQNQNTLSLKKVMDELGLHGVGAEEGKLAFNILLKEIESKPQYNIFYVSIADVFFDASFARESIVKLAKRIRLDKGLCLVDVEDEDVVLDNILGPVIRLEQPVAYYFSGSLRHIGKDKVGVPSKTNQTLFNYILEHGISTANDIAKHFDMKLNNVSTKLKELYQRGFVLRKEEKSETGGIEYLYYTIS